MKTLHFTNAYHPTSGGIRTFYTELLEAGNREGREVRVVVPSATTRVEEVGRCGRIYHVRAPRAPAFDRRYRMILPHAYCPVMGRTVVDILERERPDLVEICDKYSLPYLAAMLRRRWLPRVPRPVLVGLSCERLDDSIRAFLSGSRPALAFARWYIRHIYGPPFDAHIAVSDYTADELRGALDDRPDTFIRVAGMGVDTQGFGAHRRSPDLRSRMLRLAGGRESSVLVFYAGRVSPEKNVALLVQMLRELTRDPLSDYRLVLAGEGPSVSALRRAAGRLEGQLLFCGDLDKSALAACYASADVFVHPNPREPFGIGPLEAMASGVPVVLPAVGGVLEYATHDNAWLAEPTAEAFADAVRAARESGRTRVDAARATAQRFGWREATQRYFTTYERIWQESQALLDTSPARAGAGREAVGARVRQEADRTATRP